MSRTKLALLKSESFSDSERRTRGSCIGEQVHEQLRAQSLRLMDMMMLLLDLHAWHRTNEIAAEMGMIHRTALRYLVVMEAIGVAEHKMEGCNAVWRGSADLRKRLARKCLIPSQDES